MRTVPEYVNYLIDVGILFMSEKKICSYENIYDFFIDDTDNEHFNSMVLKNQISPTGTDVKYLLQQLYLHNKKKFPSEFISFLEFTCDEDTLKALKNDDIIYYHFKNIF